MNNTRDFASALAAWLGASSTFGNKFTRAARLLSGCPRKHFPVTRAADQEPALIENFCANRSMWETHAEAGKYGYIRGGIIADWLQSGAHGGVIFPQPVHGPDRVRLSKNRHLGERQPSWARGAYGVGEGVAVRQCTRTIRNSTRATSRTIPRRGNGRRPRNSGLRAGTDAAAVAMAGAFVGERQEDDFVFFAINRNQGYENVFANGSFQVTRHVGLHVRVDNALNERYQEVLGYSSLARTAIGGVRLTW
jgi:hypothetical protein